MAAVGGESHRYFFYTSPYRRSIETYREMAHELPKDSILGVQEEVRVCWQIDLFDATLCSLT